MVQYFAILGKLRLLTALHIGSWESQETTDAPVKRSVDGRLKLDGTALGGNLRALATRLAPRLSLPDRRQVCLALDDAGLTGRACGCAACRLFGDLYPGAGQTEAEKKSTQASKIWIFDAPLMEEGAVTPVVRDGVGLDRASGAAASAGAVKFDLEVIPAGAVFEVRLELRGTDVSDEILLAAALAEWQAGRSRLGGRSGRGLGAFALEDIRAVSLDLTLPGDLMKYLRSDEPWNAARPAPDWLNSHLDEARPVRRLNPQPAGNGAAAAWAGLTFDLQFESSFLINDALLAGLLGFDHAALVQSLPSDGGADWHPKPILTGSGLRGVLRAQAERIARTLATLESSDAAGFLQACPACDPLQSNPEAPLASCDTLLKPSLPGDQSANEADLCLACRLFGSPRRGSRLKVQDASLVQAGQPKPQDFLAVDRFTGGGLEGAKFDALSLWQPRFSACLYLENPASWELGWLVLVLRDLQDGWLTFGFGAGKGYGAAGAENLSIELGWILPDDLKPLHADFLTHSPAIRQSGLYDCLTLVSEQLPGQLAAQQAWVDDFVAVCKGFKRPSGLLPVLAADTYFDSLVHLYPVNPDLNG